MHVYGSVVHTTHLLFLYNSSLRVPNKICMYLFEYMYLVPSAGVHVLHVVSVHMNCKLHAVHVNDVHTTYIHVRDL